MEPRNCNGLGSDYTNSRKRGCGTQRHVTSAGPATHGGGKGPGIVPGSDPLEGAGG